MERAVALAPTVGRYRYRLGLVLAASGDSTKATRALTDALRVTLSDDERTQVNAALTQMRRGAAQPPSN